MRSGLRGCGVCRGSFAGFRFGYRVGGVELELTPLLEERDVLLELPGFPHLPSNEADDREEKGRSETAQEAFARRHDGLLRL